LGKREDVEQAIRREKARLVRLERERNQSLERLNALKEELNRFDGEQGGEPFTSSEKLSLFMKLFRGRDDVYAKRWTNAKKDRSGYSPACANEWVSGVCEKPKAKCGNCANRDLIPMTKKVGKSQ